MVEAKDQRLDVKISIDLSAQGKSPITKRVQAGDFQTLSCQAKKLASRFDIGEQEASLRYHDGDNWIIVEDQDDLNLAYAIAASSDGKLTFTIKPAGGSAPVEKSNQEADVVMDGEQQPVVGKKKCKKDKAKGIPRKALKNLIDNELNKQAADVFQKLLKSDELPEVEVPAELKEVVHEGVECDGCHTGPIKGIRFKCSVCKNFDYCANCEDRLQHEHAFLKLTKAGSAPDVMITILDEPEESKEPAQEQQQPNADPMEFIRQMMQSFGGMRGGRGGRGRGGCMGMGRGMSGGFPPMVQEFLNKMNLGNMSPEELRQKFAGQNWGGCHGRREWKEVRAICKSKPEGVIHLMPGVTKLIDIEVLNDTHWPWKAGCQLTLADDQAGSEIPIEIFVLPVEQEVRGKATAAFKVPLTMASHIVADPNKEYEVRLTFRGPKQTAFGEVITLKVKCVLNEVSEVDIYRLAIKLHEQLQLGSLDECIKVVKDNNGDESACIQALQRK